MPSGCRKKRLGYVLDGRICDYGCGGRAYYEFANGKVCCSILHIHCLASTFTTKGISSAPWNKSKKRPFLEMLCGCGCGGSTTTGRKYLQGHNSKTEEAKREISKVHKGKVPWNKNCKMPKEFGEKISKVKRGHNLTAWNKGLTKDDPRVAKYARKLKGKKRTDENKKLMSMIAIESGWFKGDNNPSKRPEIRKMRSEFMKGRIRPELVGDGNPMNKSGVREKHLQAVNDPDYKEEQGRQSKKRWSDEAYRSNMLQMLNRPEYKKKMRITKINQIQKQCAEGGQAQPAFNLQACKFFKQFDEDFDTQGWHGTNNGEYRIEVLGYFPDYINFDLKLIIEWDEESHYGANGNLKEKDVRRQKEIQEHFPDFRFIRIREKFQKELDYSFMEVRKQK